MFMFIYVSIFIFVYMNVCLYKCVYTYVYKCIYVVHAYIYGLYTCVYLCVCQCEYVCVHNLYIYICLYVYIFRCVNVPVYMYVYICWRHVLFSACYQQPFNECLVWSAQTRGLKHREFIQFISEKLWVGTLPFRVRMVRTDVHTVRLSYLFLPTSSCFQLSFLALAVASWSCNSVLGEHLSGLQVCFPILTWLLSSCPVTLLQLSAAVYLLYLSSLLIVFEYLFFCVETVLAFIRYIKTHYKSDF